MGLKLETGKTYIDADGRKVRIICTDMVVDRVMEGVPCVGLVDWGLYEAIYSYGKDGAGLNSPDLVSEYDPLEELPVDTPVWVRDEPAGVWKPRHYAGHKNEHGQYVAFMDGKTSHSNGGDPMMAWNYMTNVNPNDKV